MKLCIDCGVRISPASSRCMGCHHENNRRIKDRILELHDQGLSYDEIANDVSSKRRTIIDIIRLERGSRHSPAIVRKMAEAIFDGTDADFFSHKYGFTREHILKVTSCYRQNLKKHHTQRLMERVKQLVSDTMLVLPELITSKSRNARVTRARKVIYFIGMDIGVSSSDVGKFLGRDHSTVVEGRRDIERLILDDEFLRRRIENISSVVKSERFSEPVKIAAAPKPKNDSFEDMDDMDLLSLRVAQHYS